MVEFQGKGKNIDRQIANKFNKFKSYAKDIQWGFVRDKDGELYINNTDFVSDIAYDNWVALEEKL